MAVAGTDSSGHSRGAGPMRALRRLYFHPPGLTFLFVCSLFLTEAIVMLLLSRFPAVSAKAAVLLDSTILILFILPSVNFFVLRPMALQIRERKAAEEAVKLEHAKLREILEAMQDGVYIIDSNRRIEYVNSSIEKEFGPALGRMCYEYLHGRTSPCDACRSGEVLEGAAVRYERHFPDHCRTYDCFATPVSKADGRILKLEILRDITDRKKAEGVLRRSHDRLRGLSAHLQAAREEERRSVAREIHDELGQVLATLQLRLSVLTRGLRPDQEVLMEAGTSMAGGIENAVGIVQRICSELRPVMLDELGLAEAVEWQAKEFEKRSAIRCEAAVAAGGPFERDVATAVFRIFQETLTNVLRHSGATAVEASLFEKKGKLVLLVRDNGRGISREQAESPLSFGLTGMRERAAMVGGKIRIAGLDGRGSIVMAVVPLPRDGGESCFS